MTNFSIYKITNKINGKLYIGKSQGNALSRWRKHIRISNGGKEKYPRLYFAIHSAIVKYGVTNFSFEIVEEIDNEVIAFEREKFWISNLKTDFTLYNLTDGGEGPSGRKRSEESKNKMSEAQRGEKSWKAKLTEEDVKKIKILLKENKLTQKEIANTFNVTPLTINKINKGKQWWWVVIPDFGISNKIYQSRPTNAKLSEAQVKDIKILLMGSGLTQQEIAQKFGVTIQTICQINTGKRWSHVQI